MKKILFALTVVLACAPAIGEAAAGTPAGMPAFGKDKPIPVPKIVKQTLANGLQVWVLPRDGVPRVDFVLAFRQAGHVADDAAHPGFAELLAGLLTEGTAAHDSRTIAEMSQAMGGQVGGNAGTDGILVFAHALASHAGPMMRLLAEVARTPAFPENEVTLAKANALQGLKVSEAQPRFQVERALSAAMFGSHPYGRVTPTEAAIESVSVDYLKAEHARRLRPDNALLVVTGQLSAAEAMRLAQGVFGDWKAVAAASPAVPPPTPRDAPARVLIDRPGSVQTTLRIGGPGTGASTEDYVPLRLASTLLGGAFTSRINMTLREEKGYTYGASAGARIYRDGGVIVGGADVRNAVTGPSIDEFLKAYARLGSELVPAEELAMNKRYVAGSYLITNQLQGAVAHTLAANWINGRPAEFLGQYVPRIQAVSAEEIRQVGRKYFDPAAQSIILVGDKEAIAAQIAPFGQFGAGSP